MSFQPAHTAGTPTAREPRAESQRHRGMTLVELLVSVAVLAVILLAFGAILSATQKVTVRSNLLMQGNSAASAIAQIIRDDVSALTKDGFLAIAHHATDPNTDYMVFTTVGTYTSKVNSTIIANAARIAYGRTVTAVAGSDPNVLWRQVTLLTDPNGTTPPIPATDPNDYEDFHLGRYRDGPDCNTISGIRSRVVDNSAEYRRSPVIVIPPTNPTQIAALYPVLAPACLSFRVQWLNGSTWTAAVAAGNVWNATNVPLWPTAIKVTFSLQASEKAEDTLDYEVICPIRQ